MNFSRVFVCPPFSYTEGLAVYSTGPSEWLCSKRLAKFDLLTPVLRSLKCSLHRCYNDLPVDGSAYANI